MSDITAVILAAGMGVRMGARGRLMPKGLIPVGGRPMIEHSLDALRARGVGRIVLVTGHLAEQFDTYGAAGDVTLVHNPHYATTGSLRSLATGLPHVTGACLIVEGDLIYDPRALDVLDPACDQFLISSATGAGDEQYVWTKPGDDGRPLFRAISKDINAHRGAHLGEMVGLSMISAATVPVLVQVSDEVLTRIPDEHYEPGMEALSRKIALDVPKITDLAWAEIDDEDMLARAERLVFPRIGQTV